MSQSRLKILMIAEQCDPNGMSVPLIGYRFFEAASRANDVTLVTQEKYRHQLEEKVPHANISYIEKSPFAKWYSKQLTTSIMGQVNWPLYHILRYPLYAEFNGKVHSQFSKQVEEETFDIVHAITPMIPRYPVKLARACTKTPFLLGPINGGLPFPKGFAEVKIKEQESFNRFRYLSHLLPNYRKTYLGAKKILSGSTFTQEMLRQSFGLDKESVVHFSENGICSNDFHPAEKGTAELKELLFVGRLVPYKGADICIRALAYAEAKIGHSLHLTIVGDGSERPALEALAKKLRVSVTFTGWLEHVDCAPFYRKADLFVFPSIREFGGGVVLEAMASALPCIVVDYGGIGEYVTDTSGIKIPLKEKEALTRDFAEMIAELAKNPRKLQVLKDGSYLRARDFDWEEKGKRLTQIYWDILGNC